MVCLVWSVVALSHRQFCWAGGVGVCQLPAPGSVSGQAGLHGNVLQSCCLLAAFCCSTCQADAETTETTTAAGAAPPVQPLLSSLLNTQLCFHTLEGPWASLSQRTGVTREAVMSQAAHCWHLYGYFWLIATSLKSTAEKILAGHFSLLICVLA